MKGVHKHGNRWTASYGGAKRGKHTQLCADFASKDEAITQRQEWEKRYGKIDRKRKKYDGFESKYWKVIGDSPNTYHSQRMVVARNKITGEVKELNIFDIKKGKVMSKKLTQKAQHKNARGVYFTEQYKKWRAQIQLSGKKYGLGSFNTKDEAEEAYKKACKAILQKGSLPKPKQGVGNKVGHKYISKSRNSFFFHKVISGRKYTKYFHTLPEALAYRNQWLTDHNLLIPD